ncbi:MAG: FxsA family protein [Candidatus Nanopelagicales bacterium]
MGGLLALIVLVVYPVTEIAVTVWVAGMVGWLAVLGMFTVGFFLGGLVMRWAGAAAAQSLRSASRTGELPAGAVGDHALLFLGGLLIAVPGFVTDVLGLLLVIPPTRWAVAWLGGRTIGRRLRARGYSVVSGTAPDGTRVTRVVPGDVIEGEVVEVHDDEPGSGGDGASPPDDPPGPRPLPPA